MQLNAHDKETVATVYMVSLNNATLWKGIKCSHPNFN